MVTPEFLSFTKDGAVATVTLQRPEVHNAFNERVISELASAFRDVSSDASGLIAGVRSDSEGREGVKAFPEKRKPSWAETT